MTRIRRPMQRRPIQQSVAARGSWRRQVLQDRSFRLYLAGCLVSMTGTGMQFIATSWIVLELSGTNHSVAVVLVCSALPGVLLSPFIGVLADRVDRRWLAAAMDGMRALALLGVVALWFLGDLRPWHIYLMSFVVATGDHAWNAATVALVREIVPPGLLLSANAATSAAVQSGTLVGATLSGVVMVLMSPIAVMLINSASFAFSSLCLIRMRRRVPAARAPTARPRALAGFAHDLLTGVRYIQTHRQLIPIYIALLLVTSTVHVINVLLAPFTSSVLHAGPTALGYIDAAFGIGALMGNLALAKVTLLAGANRTMIGGVIGLAAGIAFFGFAMAVPVGVAGYFLIGVAYSVRIIYLTRAQEATKLDYQGRVHSTFSTLIAASSLLVYAVIGALADVISLRWIYWAQAALLLVGVVVAYRVARQAPAEHLATSTARSVSHCP